MAGSYSSSQDFMDQIGETARAARGLIRRYVVDFVDELWQLRAGDDVVPGVEPFGIAGVYSTPAADDNFEAIFTGVGDARSGVIIGTRDEAMRQAAATAAGYQPGDTMIYNSAVIAIARRESGRIDIFTHANGDNVERLAKLSELNAAIAQIRDHVHMAPGGGGGPTSEAMQGPTATTPIVLPDATGTESLQAW